MFNPLPLPPGGIWADLIAFPESEQGLLREPVLVHSCYMAEPLKTLSGDSVLKWFILDHFSNKCCVHMVRFPIGYVFLDAFGLPKQ